MIERIRTLFEKVSNELYGWVKIIAIILPLPRNSLVWILFEHLGCSLVPYVQRKKLTRKTTRSFKGYHPKYILHLTIVDPPVSVGWDPARDEQLHLLFC